MHKNSFPLDWPKGQPRTMHPRRSQFKVTSDAALRSLLAEVGKLGGSSLIINSNAQYRVDGMPFARQPTVYDAGVVIRFERKGKPMVFACDAYDTIHSNIRGLALVIDSIRAIERHGSASLLERALTSFLALPPPGAAGPNEAVTRPWWEVLGLPRDATPGAIRTAYFDLRSIHHPDKGGSAAKFAELAAAYREATGGTA